MTFIEPFGYKDYADQHRNLLVRILSLTWFTLRDRIWNQKSVIISLALLLFVSLIMIVPFGYIAIYEREYGDDEIFSLVRFQDIFKLVFNAYTTNFFLLILFGFIGARIFAEDIETNVIENYFTRMPRYGYVFSKALAVFISYLVVTVIPVLMIWTWLASAFEEDLMASTNIELISDTILFTILLSAFYTAVVLGVSASTDNRNYALTIFVVGLVVAGPFITNLIAGTTGDNIWLLLNIQEMLSPIYWDLVGPPILEDYFLPPVLASDYSKMLELDPVDSFNLMIIVFAVSGMQIYRKIIQRG